MPHAQWISLFLLVQAPKPRVCGLTPPAESMALGSRLRLHQAGSIRECLWRTRHGGQRSLTIAIGEIWVCLLLGASFCLGSLRKPKGN